MFAAWVADQELQPVKRRTREGLERTRQQGKRPWAHRESSTRGSWRRSGGCGKQGPACGGSPRPLNVPPTPSEEHYGGTVRHYDQGIIGGLKPAPPA